jgi:hypothetical protein
LINAAFSKASLVVDFYVKSTGKANYMDDLASKVPLLSAPPRGILLTLALNCLTDQYAALWSEDWNEEFSSFSWAKADPRLEAAFFSSLSRNWTSASSLRKDYERRQALVEIDVLAAMSLGMRLSELIAIYRTQFPVLEQNERDTWYDRNGRIVFTASKGLTGVGFPRKGSGRGANKTTGWEDIADMSSGTVSRTIVDDTLPGGPVERTITYEAPFDRCDRVEDYRVAWEFFKE